MRGLAALFESGRLRAWLMSAVAGLFCVYAIQLVAQQHVEPPSTCCSSMSEVQFRTIPAGQELEFSFAENSPTHAFGERRQHFVALKIPDGFIGTTIHVRTFLSSAFLSSARAVIPEFIYLGADLKPVERTVTGSFQQTSGFWRTAIVGRAEVPPDARYIMVVAADGSARRPLLNMGGGRTFSIPAAELGEFTLRLFGEPIAK